MGDADENVTDIIYYDIEEVINKTGSYGRVQIFVTAVTMLFLLFNAHQTLVLFFVADDPPWACVAKNSSDFCSKHFREEITQSSDYFSKRCDMKRKEWRFTKDEKFSIVSEFDLVCKRSSIAAFVNAGFFIGWGIGGVFTGFLADMYGRKKILCVSMILLSSASISSSFITAIWQLICLRVLVGVAYGNANTCAYTMLTEVVGSSHRILVSSFYGIPYDWSNLAVGIVAYYVRNWRKIVLYSSLPSVFIAILVFAVPESIRWMYAVGKLDQAENLVTKFGKINKKVIKNFKLRAILNDNSSKKQYTYADLLFSNIKIVVLVLAICFAWICNGLIFYGFTLESSDLGGSIYLNFALSCIVDFPSPVLLYLCCKYFGCKKSYIGLTVLISLSLIVLSVLSALSENIKYINKVNIGVAMLGKGLVSVSFLVIYLWSIELFPTVVRSQGMSLCQISSRIGSTASPFLATTLSNVYKPFPFIVMACIGVVSLLLSFLLPEVGKNKTREKFEDFFTPSSNTPVEDTINVDIDDHTQLLDASNLS